MLIYKLLEINADINTWYRQSKLPKWLKVLVAKNRRHKIYKMIDRIGNKGKYKFIASDIYEFLCYCSTSLEGKFMYINQITVIDSNPPEYTSHLIYKDKVNFHFFLDKVSNDGMEITIKREDNNGIKAVAVLNLDELGLLIGPNKYNETIITLIGGLNAMIEEMIKKILNDEIKRSERIYEI